MSEGNVKKCSFTMKYYNMTRIIQIRSWENLVNQLQAEIIMYDISIALCAQIQNIKHIMLNISVSTLT